MDFPQEILNDASLVFHVLNEQLLDRNISAVDNALPHLAKGTLSRNTFRKPAHTQGHWKGQEECGI